MKYFLQVDEKVLALRFDRKRQKCLIGGNVNFRLLIERLITNFFKKTVPRPKIYQNKIKYSFICKVNEFLIAVDFLKENGIIVQETKSLERIIR